MLLSSLHYATVTVMSWCLKNGLHLGQDPDEERARDLLLLLFAVGGRAGDGARGGAPDRAAHADDGPGLVKRLPLP